MVQLSKIDNESFGYALSNGAYGVYHYKKKMWKSKSKDLVNSICGCDIDLYGDGQKLLVIGFNSKQVEVRKHKSGEIVHTVNVDDTGVIAKVFYYDYRMAGEKQVVVVTTSGVIKGYSVTTNLK